MSDKRLNICMAGEDYQGYLAKTEKVHKLGYWRDWAIRGAFFFTGVFIHQFYVLPYGQTWSIGTLISVVCMGICAGVMGGLTRMQTQAEADAHDYMMQFNYSSEEE